MKYTIYVGPLVLMTTTDYRAAYKHARAGKRVVASNV